MAANGRGRGSTSSRTPSFIVIGMAVVIAILGFNYWNVSSKNGVLTKDLDGLNTLHRKSSLESMQARKRQETELQTCRNAKEVLQTETKDKEIVISRQEQALQGAKEENKHALDDLEASQKDLSVEREKLMQCEDSVNAAKNQLQGEQDQNQNTKQEVMACEERMRVKEQEWTQQLDGMKASADVQSQQLQNIQRSCADDARQARIATLKAVQAQWGDSALNVLRTNGVNTEGVVNDMDKGDPKNQLPQQPDAQEQQQPGAQEQQPDAQQQQPDAQQQQPDAQQQQPDAQVEHMQQPEQQGGVIAPPPQDQPQHPEQEGGNAAEQQEHIPDEGAAAVDAAEQVNPDEALNHAGEQKEPTGDDTQMADDVAYNNLNPPPDQDMQEETLNAAVEDPGIDEDEEEEEEEDRGDLEFQGGDANEDELDEGELDEEEEEDEEELDNVDDTYNGQIQMDQGANMQVEYDQDVEGQDGDVHGRVNLGGPPDQVYQDEDEEEEEEDEETEDDEEEDEDLYEDEEDLEDTAAQLGAPDTNRANDDPNYQYEEDEDEDEDEDEEDDEDLAEIDEEDDEEDEEGALENFVEANRLNALAAEERANDEDQRYVYHGDDADEDEEEDDDDQEGAVDGGTYEDEVDPNK